MKVGYVVLFLDNIPFAHVSQAMETEEKLHTKLSTSWVSSIQSSTGIINHLWPLLPRPLSHLSVCGQCSTCSTGYELALIT